ncbi:hypothetical protein B0681_09925 [Moraxella porci DSM 25326]|uniref:Uncharacterized protein n=1 Tax=Moraxella porci DSM 25326 TaxID=573983 RepID=A0A1T0CLH1_9GAMM|nr:hypothetical protein B0681_09925 [Moraxella porci DSM 25326]
MIKKKHLPLFNMENKCSLSMFEFAHYFYIGLQNDLSAPLRIPLQYKKLSGIKNHDLSSN